MFLWSWRPLTFIALIGLTAACSGSPPTAARPIVSRIPWPDHEEAKYLLVSDKRQEIAQGILTIEREGGRFRLSQRFRSASASDETEAVVRADDLGPLEVGRVILGDRGELRFQVRYFSGIAEIVRTTDQDRRVDQLNVSADAYDNASALFLWRTLPFAPGYRASYVNVTTAQVERSRSATVTLHVIGKEKVRVPAGTFDTWRVEVFPGGRRQIAWYATDGSYPLVMYDNGRQRFLLQTIEGR